MKIKDLNHLRELKNVYIKILDGVTKEEEYDTRRDMANNEINLFLEWIYEQTDESIELEEKIQMAKEVVTGLEAQRMKA